LSGTHQANDVTLKIYNVMGQVVRNLKIPAGQQSGEMAITWNGMNDQGEGIASGTYFFVMETPARRHALKLLYLK
jgi:flagellar hook assembly protein FlgD